MSLQGNEQQVLNGIESQLRTENPWLMACFLVYNRVAPRIKPPNLRYRSARKDRLAKAGKAELIVLAVAFAMLIVLVAALVLSPGGSSRTGERVPTVSGWPHARCDCQR